MTNREKLIVLIGKVQDEGRDYSDVVCSYRTSNERLADYLIANDVVPVVRCKECKWMVEFTGKDSGKPCGYGRCDNPIGLMGIVYDESYCSYPERKIDDLRA